VTRLRCCASEKDPEKGDDQISVSIDVIVCDDLSVTSSIDSETLKRKLESMKR
jgi:hypothetical protein